MTLGETAAFGLAPAFPFPHCGGDDVATILLALGSCCQLSGTADDSLLERGIDAFRAGRVTQRSIVGLPNSSEREMLDHFSVVLK